jgi:hypothetical protein
MGPTRQPPMEGTMLHPDDVEYFKHLREVGMNVAAQAGISVAVLEPKRRPNADGASGLAYCAEQRISIQVRPKKPAYDGGAWFARNPHKHNLKTLAHELAHLKEYQAHGATGHGPRFREYEAALLEVVNAANLNGKD